VESARGIGARNQRAGPESARGNRRAESACGTGIGARDRRAGSACGIAIMFHFARSKSSESDTAGRRCATTKSAVDRRRCTMRDWEEQRCATGRIARRRGELATVFPRRRGCHARCNLDAAAPSESQRLLPWCGVFTAAAGDDRTGARRAAVIRTSRTACGHHKSFPLWRAHGVDKSLVMTCVRRCATSKRATMKFARRRCEARPRKARQ